jgi:hypothetical protein
MKRAVVIWPGNPAEIKASFAEHSLHMQSAAALHLSRALPWIGQVFVFDRGLPFSMLPQPSHADFSFSGPIIIDSAHNSPHFLSSNEPVQPVEVCVMFWPVSLPGKVHLELDGVVFADILIDQLQDDSFEAKVPLPEPLASGTHVIILRALAHSSIVAQSSVTIIVSEQSLTMRPKRLPTPEAVHLSLQPPPQTIPPHLFSHFTMNNTADVDYMYPSSIALSMLTPRLASTSVSGISCHVMFLVQVFLGRRRSVSTVLLFWN